MNSATNALFFWGRPFSPLYGLVMKLREQLYKKGIFRSYNFPVPVISVGNLVLGGTGKTPTVMQIAQLLKNHGYKPGIVSRGYGGKAKDAVNIVSNFDKVLLPPKAAGDEPYLLASKLPGIPVITGKKRAHPCNYAIAELGCDCLVLDDGFQHIAVQRDIDIILFNATDLAGNSRIFPGGPLREPVSALHRASCFLLTGKDKANETRAENFKELLSEKFPGKNIYFSHNATPTIYDWKTGTPLTHKAEKYVAFCGIASPERFAKTLRDNEFNISEFIAFRDHIPYDRTVYEKIEKAIKSTGADGVITTEKDAVKLVDTIPFSPHIVKLHVNLGEDFTAFLLKKLVERR